MYTTNIPNIILPTQALEVLEGIEQEMGRPILLHSVRPVASRRRARILLNDAWMMAQNFEGNEPITDEVKANAIFVVFGATETGGNFTYIPAWPNEAFIEGQLPPYDRDFSGGEYVRVLDEAPEAYGISEMPNFADLHKNLACFSFRYSRTTWLPEVRDNLDWEKIIGVPVRSVAAPDFTERATERRHERDELAFAQYMTQTRGRALANARQRLSAAEREITAYTESLANRMSQARDLSLEIVGIEARLAGQSSEDEWRKRWSSIVGHPRVLEVRLNNGSLIVTTDDLFLVHPRSGETRWLGRFDLTVSAISGQVTIKNLDNPKAGRDHPHVEQHLPCWGSAASMISTIMSQGELYALIDMCIVFLETFNINDDWGAYAAYWFDVADETPTRLNPQEQPVLAPGDSGETNGVITVGVEPATTHDTTDADAGYVENELVLDEVLS